MGQSNRQSIGSRRRHLCSFNNGGNGVSRRCGRFLLRVRRQPGTGSLRVPSVPNVERCENVFRKEAPGSRGPQVHGCEAGLENGARRHTWVCVLPLLDLLVRHAIEDTVSVRRGRSRGFLLGFYLSFFRRTDCETRPRLPHVESGEGGFRRMWKIVRGLLTRMHVYRGKRCGRIEVESEWSCRCTSFWNPKNLFLFLPWNIREFSTSRIREYNVARKLVLSGFYSLTLNYRCWCF